MNEHDTWPGGWLYADIRGWFLLFYGDHIEWTKHVGNRVTAILIY